MWEMGPDQAKGLQGIGRMSAFLSEVGALQGFLKGVGKESDSQSEGVPLGAGLSRPDRGQEKQEGPGRKLLEQASPLPEVHKRAFVSSDHGPRGEDPCLHIPFSHLQSDADGKTQ